MNAPRPMLATLTERRFSSPDWVFERKLDGVRALAVRERGTTALWSRNGLRLDATFPEVAAALDGPGPDFTVDGEIVAFDGPRTSFARLQTRLHRTGGREGDPPVHYYLFDLLSWDGHDLTDLPLRDRKRLLRRAFAYTDPLRYCPHRNTDGEDYYDRACERGWEGVIAKRAASRYRPGRSKDWRKFKCVRDQEFVVGGYTDPKGSRTGFGALLVGHHLPSGALRYAGRVGTGFDERTLRSLHRRLAALAREDNPFDGPIGERGVHWVRPELVVAVAFTEWTGDGMLRHPRFEGERVDKAARDVVREDAVREDAAEEGA